VTSGIGSSSLLSTTEGLFLESSGPKAVREPRHAQACDRLLSVGEPTVRSSGDPDIASSACYNGRRVWQVVLPSETCSGLFFVLVTFGEGEGTTLELLLDRAPAGPTSIRAR